MKLPMQVPDLDTLVERGFGVAEMDEPWIHQAVAWARNGDEVSVVWDEMAQSATLFWRRSEETLARFECEMVTVVSVDRMHDAWTITIEARSSDAVAKTQVVAADSVQFTGHLLAD